MSSTQFPTISSYHPVQQYEDIPAAPTSHIEEGRAEDQEVDSSLQAASKRENLQKIKNSVRNLFSHILISKQQAASTAALSGPLCSIISDSSSNSINPESTAPDFKPIPKRKASHYPKKLDSEKFSLKKCSSHLILSSYHPEILKLQKICFHSLSEFVSYADEYQKEDVMGFVLDPLVDNRAWLVIADEIEAPFSSFPGENQDSVGLDDAVDVETSSDEEGEDGISEKMQSIHIESPTCIDTTRKLMGIPILIQLQYIAKNPVQEDDRYSFKYPSLQRVKESESTQVFDIFIRRIQKAVKELPRYSHGVDIIVPAQKVPQLIQ